MKKRETDWFYGYKTICGIWLEWGKIDTESKSKSVFFSRFASPFVSLLVVAVHIIRWPMLELNSEDASKMRFMSSLLATPIPTIPLHNKINWHPETVFSHTITVSLSRSCFRVLFFILSVTICWRIQSNLQKKRKDLLILVLKTNLSGSLKLKSNLLLRKRISILSKR